MQNTTQKGRKYALQQPAKSSNQNEILKAESDKVIVLEMAGDLIKPQLKDRVKVLAIQVPREEWANQSKGIYTISISKKLITGRIKHNHLINLDHLLISFDNNKSEDLPVAGDDIDVIWKLLSVISLDVE